MNNSFISILIAIILTLFLDKFHKPIKAFSNPSYVYTDGTHFALEGKPFYLNGFNAYWLMYMASDPSTRNKVTTTFQQASKYGMNVARTWAFTDGGSRPLQSSPGVYNEQMFEGLDFVISEAQKYGIRLILGLVNNWDILGGKKQYVEWAQERGQQLTSEDDFFTNPMVKGFYKNHVKVVLTRVNTITKVAYKDDPTILAWELMNEARCPSDLSGKTIQNWITEMAAYLKSIDKNHLLEIGLEGFYGDNKKQYNPNYLELGTNFISNNQIWGIDFTTIHIYPDQWLQPGTSPEDQDKWASQWIQAHIDDSKLLKKPLLIAEFGKSSSTPGYNVTMRDNYFGKIYGTIFNCAKYGGPCGGGLFWQLLAQEMDSFGDSYAVVLQVSPSTDRVMALQSLRLSKLLDYTNRLKL
ncbi:mannan endo-1,4-beta-mannosidase 4-like [Nicotiana tabacum]|uniref:mannan endo-1,4-beta-mannosidase n=1 Tax=Nicotiana tabacum TaxID=4097 RepID=A0A1S4DKZ4_TOBAC|nr:PREDICTED: mannan endo-1,4-beta-mannosidase 4-like [Nicotiana tabacum]